MTANTQPSKNVEVSAAPPRSLFTISKFAERHSSFLTISALTNQIFKSNPRKSSKGEIPGNGMLDFGVIVRVGGRVLIDEAAYFAWVDSLQGKVAA